MNTRHHVDQAVTHNATADRIPHRHRLLAAAAAVVTCGASMGLLLGGFGQQSNLPWLRATPANMERMALCEPVRGRAEKEACVRGVVAAVVNGPAPAVAALPPSMREPARHLHIHSDGDVGAK